MTNPAKWFLIFVPLFLSGCIASALAAQRETVIDWKEKCEVKCKEKSYPVRMYHLDGRVEDVTVAIYDFSNNVGCYCPPPVEKK